MRLIFKLSLIFIVGCSSPTPEYKEKWSWNIPKDTTPFTSYDISDLDKISFYDGDSVYVQNHINLLSSPSKLFRKDKIPVKELFTIEYKKTLLDELNKFQIPLHKVSIGSPISYFDLKKLNDNKRLLNNNRPYYDALGVYIDDEIWINIRPNGFGSFIRKQTKLQPPLPNSKLDSFLIANFKFTPDMLKAGLHGRVSVGIEVYPRDGTLSVFQVMDTTLGIDKEIKRVLYSMDKWIPSYDSITGNFIRAEMVYPFPIQHPDSAKLEPYEY